MTSMEAVRGLSIREQDWRHWVRRGRRRSNANDDLSVRAARLHQAVSISDVVEVEDLGGLGHIGAVRDSIDDVLKRNFGQRKFRIACHQGAREYAQVPRAGDLKYRLQIGEGSAAAQKTRQAG